MAKDKFKDNDVAELVQTITALRRDVKKISESVRMSVKPVYTNQEAMEIFGIASATLKLWRDNGLMEDIPVLEGGHISVSERPSF